MVPDISWIVRYDKKLFDHLIRLDVIEMKMWTIFVFAGVQDFVLRYLGPHKMILQTELNQPLIKILRQCLQFLIQ